MADPNNPLTPRLNQAEKRLDVKNKIINGGFDFWQRGTSFTSVISGSYVADRYRIFSNGIVSNVSREADVPFWSNSDYSLKVSIQNAIASPANTDFLNLRQKIEGLFFKDLIGKDIKIKFSVKSNKTGSHGMYIFSEQSGGASYNTSYNISQADVWEEVTLTIPKPIGFENTFAKDNTTSINILWLMTDIDNASIINTWQSGNQPAGDDGNVQIGSSISDYFQITDVMVYDAEYGEDIPFQRAGINIVEEEKLCLRYYEKTANSDPGIFGFPAYRFQNQSVYVRETVDFKVIKRANPYCVSYNPTTFTFNNMRTESGANVSSQVTSVSKHSFVVYTNSFVTGQAASFMWTADAEL